MSTALDRLLCLALFRHTCFVSGLESARLVAGRQLEERTRAALIGELDRLVVELDLVEEAQLLRASDIWNEATTDQLWDAVRKQRSLLDEAPPR